MLPTLIKTIKIEKIPINIQYYTLKWTQERKSPCNVSAIWSTHFNGNRNHLVIFITFLNTEYLEASSSDSGYYVLGNQERTGERAW
jgi:hypothetical protein